MKNGTTVKLSPEAMALATRLAGHETSVAALLTSILPNLQRLQGRPLKDVRRG